MRDSYACGVRLAVLHTCVLVVSSCCRHTWRHGRSQQGHTHGDQLRLMRSCLVTSLYAAGHCNFLVCGLSQRTVLHSVRLALDGDKREAGLAIAWLRHALHWVCGATRSGCTHAARVAEQMGVLHKLRAGRVMRLLGCVMGWTSVRYMGALCTAWLDETAA
jgi:hypothetical protein